MVLGQGFTASILKKAFIGRDPLAQPGAGSEDGEKNQGADSEPVSLKEQVLSIVGYT